MGQRKATIMIWLCAPVSATGAPGRSPNLYYGQLLLSRKLTGAFEHLSAGFSLAGPMMAAEDYLNVRRRHALLRRLELASTPASPHSLDALLVEAAVIVKLEGRSMPRFTHDPCDTSG